MKVVAILLSGDAGGGVKQVDWWRFRIIYAALTGDQENVNFIATQRRVKSGLRALLCWLLYLSQLTGYQVQFVYEAAAKDEG